ncbi:MAG: group II intron maturase-specific domain-containing protein, partial [Succinivibrionaceae bacterium]|nr:group II intron maturase-specific domain-containing protein [Succinivibrionaceae bacterium]
SKKAAERILSHVKKNVVENLFRKVNETKTKIVRAGNDTQFLGFAFTRSEDARRRKEYPLRTLFTTVHRKKRDKLIKVLKELLDRRAKGGIERVKEALRLKLRGWCNYFGEAIPVTWRNSVDQWIRRRIRQLLWKQWKKPENRRREFCRRLWKAPPDGAVAFSSNRYWRMSENWYIHTALSNEQLEREGWSWLSLYS